MTLIYSEPFPEADILQDFLMQARLPLDALSRFEGCGMYGLYYRGSLVRYADIGDHPIYIGKASKACSVQSKTKLYDRLARHARSIHAVDNLEVTEFDYRVWLLPINLAALFEDAMILYFKPFWNLQLKGFGNHAVGATRRSMRRSPWDEAHPGRHGAAMGRSS